MSRPRKWRKICVLPENDKFGPLEIHENEEYVNMSVDEYETIRLIDLEGYTQEECALKMNVARTTIQGIYNTARYKLADVLVHGKNLVICGGNIELCDGTRKECSGGKCCRLKMENRGMK
ncbi:MAG: DUF134 domain-containing protein [Bacillota bacterium]|nr:DUF134 domain-containing protein [Bacillota bacterium]